MAGETDCSVESWKVIIRNRLEEVQGVQILSHLSKSRFCQTYLTQTLERNARLFLVEWDKSIVPPQYDEELAFWRASTGALPMIAQFHDDPEQPSILTPEFQGISVMSWASMSVERLTEREMTLILSQLMMIFKEAFTLQIEVNPLTFGEKIYHTEPGGMKFHAASRNPLHS